MLPVDGNGPARRQRTRLATTTLVLRLLIAARMLPPQCRCSEISMVFLAPHPSP
jgi:hypothetical protein